MQRLISLGVFVFAPFMAFAQATDPAISVINVAVEPDIVRNALGHSMYVIDYTIENDSSAPISLLQVNIRGRNAEGRIVENVLHYVITPGSFPGGLTPGDSIVMHHGLEITNPNEQVISVDVVAAQMRHAE